MDRFLDEGEGLLAAITNNNNNNNTSSNNNNSNQTPPPSTPSSSSSNNNLTPSASASTTSSSNHINSTGNSSGEGATGSSSAVGDCGNVLGNHNSSKTNSSPAVASDPATTSNGAAGSSAQPGSATSARSQSEESNGVDFDDSSSNGSKHSGGGGGGDGSRSGVGGTTTSLGKKDYVIPSLPPSETGKLNQQLWRENQRPNVAMHALLYGVLPAGYRIKDVSAAAVKDSSSFKGSEVSVATTPTKVVTSSKFSDESQPPAKIPRLEPSSADAGGGAAGAIEKMEMDETAGLLVEAERTSQGRNNSGNLSSGRTVSNTSQLTAVDGARSSDHSLGTGQTQVGPPCLFSLGQPKPAVVSSPLSSSSPSVATSGSQSSLNPSLASVSSVSPTSNALKGASGKSPPGKLASLKRGELILSENLSSPSPGSPKLINSSSPSPISNLGSGQSPIMGTLVSKVGGNNPSSPSPSSRQGSPRISSPTLNRGGSGSSKPLARIDLIAQTLSREKALATGSGASSTSPLASTVGGASNKNAGVPSDSAASTSLSSPAPGSGLGRSTSIGASVSSVRGPLSQFSGQGASAASSEKAVL